MSIQNPLPRARHEHLLRQLELHGSVSAASIADELGVSQVTVRRDIVDLETAGRLTRVHGGAIAKGAPPEPQSARANIGVVVPGTVGHFLVIIKGMDAAATGARARLVLATSQYRPELERRQVERLVEIGVRGLVFAPTLHPQGEAALASWVDQIPVPVVFLERRLDSLLLAFHDSVRTDHARGAMLAVEHLANLGHHRIGLAVFERTPTAPLVREGFAAAADRAGVDIGFVVGLPKDDEHEALDGALGSVLDSCLEAKTTAVLVHTDAHAARLVELAADRGIHVPGDLAIVAYDDDTAAFGMVPLTAVTAPRRDLGGEVMRIMADRIAEPPASRGAPRHLTLLPHLTVRDSCGALP